MLGVVQGKMQRDLQSNVRGHKKSVLETFYVCSVVVI